MNNPSVFTAAFAAGMMVFAAHAKEGGISTGRIQSVTKVEKQTKSAKAKPCPYLFGCSDSKDKDEKKPVARKATAVKTASAKSRKSATRTAVTLDTSAKAGKRRARTETLDTVTTASIKSQKSEAAARSAADGTKYSAIVSRYAASYGVPVSLAHAVIAIESNYRPNMVGSAGEIGLMQIKPATARMMGYSGSAKGLYSPETNIKYGMKYLAMARNLGGGTTCGTILKYNAGHAATRMNPVSSAYCSKVKVQMAALGTGA